MWFRQVARSSEVRLGAVDIEARYTLMRSYDGTAPIFALGAPLLGIDAADRGARLATFMTSSPSAAGGSPHPVVGLVDTVVVLRQRGDGAVVRRGVHVQRMRGSSHDSTVRELVVDGHGISIGGPLLAPPPEVGT